MAKFLEQVADHILSFAGENALHTAVILPGRRAEIFLKNELKKRVQSTYWLPDFFTIDEFIVSNSGIIEMEAVNLYFELFKIHQDIAGKEARTLDDFLAWAPVMLNDFNDIDLYLADAEAVLTYLSEVRAMQLWNPSGKPLTDLQKNYLAFYNSLHTYYLRINKNLAEKGYGYKGMIYRAMLKDIESISAGWPWRQFVLVGFNALSLAEKKIFGYLKDNFDTAVLFDVDGYYFSEKTYGNQEAGRFIKDLVQTWKPDKLKWISDGLSSTEKKINILGIPRRIGQVKYASQIVEEWFAGKDEGNNKERSVDELYTDAAIVLADEKLLVPLLHSLPQPVGSEGEKIPFNVTMGYPLKNSSVVELITQWLTLLQAVEYNSKAQLPVKNILEILNNAFFNSCSGYYTENISQHIAGLLLKKHLVYASRQQVLDLYGEDQQDAAALIDLILTRPASPPAFVYRLTEFLLKCKPAVSALAGSNPILREQYILTTTQIKKISSLLDESYTELSYRALEKILVQIINRIEVNLKGEPLNGIQVMGMLETRTLDFNNLIILSANDGILPKTETIESFIPFDIRHNFKLPLPKDKTDVYAYHFFRLLQRAKSINLIYNAEPDALGGGEKSRFILQLHEELVKVNPLIRINDTGIRVPMGKKSTDVSITIPKTGEISERITRMFEKGLSPTALTSFINCPLQFYFHYILGLKTPDRPESTIEAHSLGKVIHGVLEDLYKQFTGKAIETTALQLNLDEISRRVMDKFGEEFAGGDLTVGQNLLIVEVAKQYITNYLKIEKADLAENPRRLLSTEEKLETTILANGQPVKLRGIVDRADQEFHSDTIRIVDYKTGQTEPKNVNLKDWESLTTDPEKSKAFQLLFYAYLFASGKKHTGKNLEAGIYSMRNISKGLIPLSLPDGARIAEGLTEFEKSVKGLATRIADTGEPFYQTEDEKRCRYCDFKNICNRAELSF